MEKRNEGRLKEYNGRKLLFESDFSCLYEWGNEYILIKTEHFEKKIYY